MFQYRGNPWCNASAEPGGVRGECFSFNAKAILSHFLWCLSNSTIEQVTANSNWLSKGVGKEI